MKTTLCSFLVIVLSTLALSHSLCAQTRIPFPAIADVTAQKAKPATSLSSVLRGYTPLRNDFGTGSISPGIAESVDQLIRERVLAGKTKEALSYTKANSEMLLYFASHYCKDIQPVDFWALTLTRIAICENTYPESGYGDTSLDACLPHTVGYFQRLNEESTYRKCFDPVFSLYNEYARANITNVSQ